MDEMTIGAKIELNTKDFDRGISNAQKNLKGFEKQTVNLGKSLGDSVKKSTQSINDGLKNWGVNFDQFFDKGSSILSDFGLDIEKLASHFGMSGKLIAGIIAVTSALEKMGQAMDEATAEIVKGTGATGEALQGLEQSARNAMIGGLGATAQDVAGIVADLNTRFGSTGEELTELADTFDMFAGVTGQDTRQAINDVADTMLKWGVDVKHSTKLLDELTKAGQDSGASVSSLTNDLKSGQAIFQQFGMSIEDSLAFLANLKRNGLESSTALTAMRTAMANFTAQGISAKEGFEQVGEAIKNATSDTEAMQIALATFGNRGGADMVKVFRSGAIDIKDYSDALKNATDVMATTDEASRTASDAMDDLKATLMGAFGQFGQAISEPFRDIIDIVRELFSVVAPTFDAIGGYVRTLFTTVSGSVKKIVVMIVDLAKRMNVSGGVLGKILNQMGKTFGKVFGGIVWVVDKAYRGIAIGIDYIKIGLTKLGKGLSDIFRPIIEGFTKGFNKIIETINGGINKYNSLIDSLGLDILKVQTVQPINVEDLILSEDEANARIAELQADIDQLLGRTEATAIETSQAVFGSFDSAISDIERESGNASEAEQKRYADLMAWEDKLINQKIQNLELEKKNETQRLKNAEASAEQIESVEKKYNDMILALKEKLIEHERQKELEAVKDTENSAQAKAKINEYYDKQRQALHAETVDAIVNNEKKIVDHTQEWADKIRGLQGTILDQEEELLLATEESEKEKYKIKKEFIKKRLALELEELEIQQERAEKGAVSEEELERIREYFELKRKIAEQEARERERKEEEEEGENEENENNEKKELGFIEKLKQAYAKLIEKVAPYFRLLKNIAKVYITTAKVTVKAFSVAVKSIASLVSAVGNVFLKLFDFNNDEMLDSLLEFEDKILTFFTSGASQIPAFVKSVIDSVDVLVGNIENLINPEGIANALDNMIKYAVDKLPSILTKIIQIASTLIQTVAKTIGDNADGLVSAIGSVIMALVRELPNLAKTIIPAILNIFTSIGQWISDNAEEFGKIISETISSIIDGIVDFIQGGGLKTVLTAIISMFKAIINAIADNIDPFVNAIIDALPDIVDAIADFIKSTNEVLPKIVKAVLKLILAIIDAVAEMFEDDEMFQSVIDAVLEIVVAIIQAIIQAIPKLMNLIVKAVFQIIRNLPYVIKEIVKAIISIFTDMDWGELGKSFLEVFKSIFSGIGSVAKTWAGNFVEFGKNMIKGLWKGIKSFGSWIWEHVKNFFKDFLKKIKKFFGIHSPSTVFADIGGNMIKGLWNGIKNLGSWLKDNVLKLFKNLLSGIKSVFSKVGDFFGDLWNAIKDGASDGVENVKKFFSGLGNFFSGACSNIKNFFSMLWGGIKDGASDVVSRIQNAFSGIGEFFSGVCSNIGNFFSGLWSGIKNGAESAGNFIKSVFSGVKDFFETVFSGIGNFFGNVFSGMKDKLSDFTSTVSSGVGTVVDKVKDFGQTVGSGIKTGVQTVGSGIKSTVENIGSGIKSGVKSAGRRIKKFFGFATGVNNAPRGLSLVGEQGPELIDMRGGERVYTAQNTRDILSNAGRSNSFNVTFNNTQDTTAFAMMRQLKAYNRQMKLNGVF